MLLARNVRLIMSLKIIYDTTRLKTLFQPQDVENTDKSDIKCYIYKEFEKEILTITIDDFDNPLLKFFKSP